MMLPQINGLVLLVVIVLTLILTFDALLRGDARDADQ